MRIKSVNVLFWAFCSKKYNFVLLLGAIFFFYPASGLTDVLEGYYNYVFTRPTDAQTPYRTELNGIAHDKNNWFLSQNNDSPRIWKIPIDVDLANLPDSPCGKNGILCVWTNNYEALSQYNHVGDIDHYQYDSNTGYIVLSLESGKAGVDPAIAILRGEDLSYVGYFVLDHPGDLVDGYSSCSWVAIDLNGKLYTSSNNRDSYVQRYRVNWDAIHSGENVELIYEHEFPLMDEDGNLLIDFGYYIVYDSDGNPVWIKHDGLGPQGGAFSQSGQLLYIVNGNEKRWVTGRDGISVFDMATGLRVAYSTRAEDAIFRYNSKPGDFVYQEPEGLTIWDLDTDSRANPIHGQLHVILLDNAPDEIYIRHYTEKLYVDAASPGPFVGDPLGGPSDYYLQYEPFRTIQQAIDVMWDGSQLVIESGHYPENVVIDKKTRLIVNNSDKGSVIIGR